ncbi:MAG: RNA ligase family protein [Candidatus Nitrosotenuis sp.]
MKTSKLVRITPIENDSLRYDIEVEHSHNFFADGILVHNSNCQIIFLPNHHEMTPEIHEEMLFIDNALVDEDDVSSGFFAVASKGLGAQGLCFKFNEANKNNVYLQVTRERFSNIARSFCDYKVPVVILGEVYGSGIQDLAYGCKQGEIGFRVFDIYVGFRGRGRFLNDDELDDYCNVMGIERVPILYRGPFNKEKLLELTQQAKSVFDPNQISEGAVIKPVVERFDPVLGRVAVKMINEAYYLRKGGTEHN